MDNVVVAYENREVVKFEHWTFPLKTFKELCVGLGLGLGLGVSKKVYSCSKSAFRTIGVNHILLRSVRRIDVEEDLRTCRNHR